ncbi:MAG TPA: DinB family protein, partial [Flavisolibacter sp.]|nr:DinB family protein [Flavisolibacter sp.]
MNKKIEMIKGFRFFLLKQIEHLTTKQLNEIPLGHNNNVIWNLAHMTTVVQNMCYVRAGLPVAISERYVSPFMPGTRPNGWINEQEIEHIKEVFVTSLDQLQSDLD